MKITPTGFTLEVSRDELLLIAASIGRTSILDRDAWGKERNVKVEAPDMPIYKALCEVLGLPQGSES